MTQIDQLESACLEDSFLNTRSRFNDTTVAESYVLRKNHLETSKNRREMTCIVQALEGVPAGTKVLDLPCGSGRLENMLLERGYEVVAADYSDPMLEVNRKYHEDLFKNSPEKLSRLTIEKQDVLNTTYEDNTFDAIICNRLLHHYPESEIRQKVLKELARITKKKLIVSFFSNFALSALKFHLGKKLQGVTPTDRVPIWLNTFKQDVEASGLKIRKNLPVRYGVSPQTYLLLEK